MNVNQIKKVLSEFEDMKQNIWKLITEISNIQYNWKYLYNYKNSFANHKDFNIELDDSKEIITCYWEEDIPWCWAEYFFCELKYNWFEMEKDNLENEIKKEIDERIKRDLMIKQKSEQKQNDFQYNLYLELKEKFEWWKKEA